jgi:hypothetical protein
LKEGGKERFSFHAIVVETSSKDASRLCERFYKLKHPSVAMIDYPYIGNYQFVPLLQSKEWSIQKIYNLACLHVATVENLRTLYINNLSDLHNVVADNGDSLMHILQNLVPSTTDHNNTSLLHSVHNTGCLTTKAMLVQRDLYEDALGQLLNLQNILANNIVHKYHQFVFIPGTSQ